MTETRFVTVPAPRYLVFLDFDGVLHTRQSGVHFARANALGSMLAAFEGLRVVVSSSWKELYLLGELQRFCGPVLGPLLVGQTPDLVIPDGFEKPQVRLHADGTTRSANASARLWYQRHAEITTWLDDRRCTDIPWLAVDDFEHFFPPGCPALYLVDDGLTEEDFSNISARIESEVQRAS